MSILKKTIIVFVLLFTTLTHAQDEKLPSYFSNQKLQLSNLQIIDNSLNTSITEPQVINSTISLKQIGNENIVLIEERSSQGIQKVFQVGDRNNYQFINYTNNVPYNLGVLQTGNENSLKIEGMNSMFKNFTITQFNGAKMTILNY